MFKIDKAGFYKNRWGSKVQIERCPSSGLWKDNTGRVFDLYGYNALDSSYDIIAHWEEPICTADCESEEKFYLVWDDKAQEPYGMYGNFEEARKAAQRAAQEYPKETFHIMQAIAAYTAEVEIKEIKI